MREVTGQNFGLLIAYVIPGFVSLAAVGRLAPIVSSWLQASSTIGTAATVGGFLYITLASVGAGLTVSTLRWAFIDTLHHWTGMRRPPWDDSKLQANLAAFEALVENHYRYYQFYANMLVAMAVVLTARRLEPGRSLGDLDLVDCGIALMGVLYWAGSRDTLRNYYSRAAVLLGTRERQVHDDERSQPRGAGKRGSNQGHRRQRQPEGDRTPAEGQTRPRGRRRDRKPEAGSPLPGVK